MHSYLPISSTVPRRWETPPRTDSWMVQISSLVASQEHKFSQVVELKTEIPVECPTKMYPSEADRQFTLPETWEDSKKENMMSISETGRFKRREHDVYLRNGKFQKKRTWCLLQKREDSKENMMSTSETWTCNMNTIIIPIPPYYNVFYMWGYFSLLHLIFKWFHALTSLALLKTCLINLWYF